MARIDTSDWKEFVVGDLFEKLQLDIKNDKFNKTLDVFEESTDEFNLPLVNAKHGNNGIMYYGRESDFETAEMTIDIVQNGAIATGDVYAQPQKTGVLWDAYLVKPKADIESVSTLMFLATVLEKSIKDKFSYDNKCTWDKAKLLTMMLPADAEGNPDWAYMDSYMSEVMRESEASLENLRQADGDRHAVDIAGWKEFTVGELFDIHPTSAYKMTNAQLMDDGDNPVVVNSSYSNGVGGYTSLETTERGNLVTFSDTTTAEAVFYQPDAFVGYPHVQGMYPKGEYAAMWGELHLLFFVTVFKQSAKLQGFDYAFKFTREIAAGMKVPLPVDADGHPDWKYMENYMSEVMQTSEGILPDLSDVGGGGRA